MDIIKLQADQEAANFEACRCVAVWYNGKTKEQAESCDAGEHKCIGCPWNKPEAVKFDRVTIETNYGNYTLTDVTWTPYNDERSCNNDGWNGYIEGLVESGGETSRLFHATSFRDQTGTRQRFDYAHYTKMSRRKGVPHWSLVFCG